MKIPFLITARLKSKRLKKKIIRKINNKEILSHMIDRIKHSKSINKIVICTSKLAEDKPLCKLAKKNKIDFYQGSPDDVLSRLLNAAKKYKAKHVINITADCPLVDPFYIDKVANQLKKKNFDLIRTFDLPHGIFVYGIKVKALEKICKIKKKSDTEVWERYFTDTGIFKIHDLKIRNKEHIWPGLRLTLDYFEDLKLIRLIFKNLYKKNKIFKTGEIIRLIRKQPKLMEINKNCSKKFSNKYQKENEIKLIKNVKDVNLKFSKYKTFHEFLAYRGVNT